MEERWEKGGEEVEVYKTALTRRRAEARASLPIWTSKDLISHWAGLGQEFTEVRI